MAEALCAVHSFAPSLTSLEDSTHALNRTRHELPRNRGPCFVLLEQESGPCFEVTPKTNKAFYYVIYSHCKARYTGQMSPKSRTFYPAYLWLIQPQT